MHSFGFGSRRVPGCLSSTYQSLPIHPVPLASTWAGSLPPRSLILNTVYKFNLSLASGLTNYFCLTPLARDKLFLYAFSMINLIKPTDYRPLAERCGCTWQNVQSWRRLGRVPPEHLETAAAYLGVSPELLNPDFVRYARRIVAAAGDEAA